MIRSSKQLVDEANSEIKSINIAEAKKLHDKGEAVFVDLRDIRELEFEGKIKGAIHAPRGMLEFWIDPASPYHRRVFSSGKAFVFFCAAGWRSALATKQVQDMGLENVCHIMGGFSAWKKEDGDIEKTDNDLSNDDYAKRAEDALLHIGQKKRLGEQIAFIMEIDKLKEIWRQTPLLDNSRKENDAEHSWQLAMMALVLADHAPKGADILRVLKMVLIHDIVEIDAGDNPAYSVVSKNEQHVDEIKAAERLFGLLPDDLAKEFRFLWDEFEQMQTPDALFARSMDRLQPFLHNYFTNGEMWLRHEITKEQVDKRMKIVKKGTPLLHDLINDLTKDALEKGYLLP